MLHLSMSGLTYQEKGEPTAGLQADLAVGSSMMLTAAFSPIKPMGEVSPYFCFINGLYYVCL